MMETPESRTSFRGGPRARRTTPGGRGQESPGVPGEDETGTGNPDNAGADE